MAGIPGPAWLCFIGGSLLIGFGGVLAALGWHVLSGQWQRARRWRIRLPVGLPCVVVGALVIGGGGCWTTRGWNLVEQQSRMEAHLIAIAREWEVNDWMLSRNPLFTSEDEKVLGERRLYPRFEASALSDVLTSGLFRSATAKERSLLTLFTFYKDAISAVNVRLEDSDRVRPFTRDPSEIAQARRRVREDDGFETFKDIHRQVRGLLEREYPQAWKERILTSPTTPRSADSSP